MKSEEKQEECTRRRDRVKMEVASIERRTRALLILEEEVPRLCVVTRTAPGVLLIQPDGAFAFNLSHEQAQGKVYKAEDIPGIMMEWAIEQTERMLRRIKLPSAPPSAALPEVESRRRVKA